MDNYILLSEYQVSLAMNGLYYISTILSYYF